MRQINIHAAKTQLSALVDEAASGEPFVIAKAGRPMVTVQPYNAAASYPRVGFLKGLVSVPADFDNMSNEVIVALFESDL